MAFLLCGSRHVNHVLAPDPGPVIGGQTYRIPPLTTAAWGEKKILFDETTRSVWPNAKLSERANYTRGIRIDAV